jgi:hypothetical protein
VTAHLTDAELRRGFADAVSSPDDLLRADDHLAGCDRCRMRARALSGTVGPIDDLREQLHPFSIHLSDEELQLLVEGRLLDDAKDAALRHVASCSACMSQMADLRSWAAPAPPARYRLLAVAAALFLAVLIPTAIWQARLGRQTTSPAPVGFEALGPSEQTRVRAALNTGVAALPDFMGDLESPREVLMGPPTGRSTFTLVTPVETGVESDRPQFEWQPTPGADGYDVTVFDERSMEVARSSTLTQTSWIPVDPLPRNRTYAWQVTAHRGNETVKAPVAPMPSAKFHIVDARTAEVLQRMEAEHPQAHLLLGILNMEAGIRDQATQHLRQVRSDDPHADLAQRSLERLSAGR